MKVYWHIGPHKTGTTALQHALRQRAASSECGYAYPTPSMVDVIAHAQLAWHFLGLAGCPRNREIMLHRVAGAERAGFKKIVFSSEEFSRAIFVDDQFESFARLSEQFDCELVLTLSPLPQRIVPELQEAVKHGDSFDLDSLPDLMRLCATRPGLRPDFLSASILGTKANSVSVIHVDKNEPAKIYRAMSEVIGEPLPIPTSTLVNMSSPIMKTLWLSALNRHSPGIPWETSRPALDAAYLAAVQAFPGIEGLAPRELPSVFVAHMTSVWESQLKFLEVMQDAGRLRCF